MATSYVILTEVDHATWQEVGSQEGSSDLSAIKAFLESNSEHGEGIYRAVPRRSWGEEPHTLKPKVSWV